MSIVAGQNEIGTGLLEMRAKQKLGVADFDMIGRRPFRQREPRYVRVIIVLGVKTAQHPEFLPSVRFTNGSISKSRAESPEVGIVIVLVFPQP